MANSTVRGGIVVGIGIAAITMGIVVFLSRPIEAAPPIREMVPDPTTPPTRTAPVPYLRTGTPSQSDGGLVAKGEPRPAGDVEESMEEHREKLLAMYASKISQVSTEPQDRMWAANFEMRALDELRAIAVDGGRSARVLDARCGSRTCVVTFEWDSFETARNDYSWLPTAATSYTSSCSKIILLPEPEDATRTYQTKLVLECERNSP